MIQLDMSKSPAVTFATLDNGTVLACEPDGSKVFGMCYGPSTCTRAAIREALACVALAYTVRR